MQDSTRRSVAPRFGVNGPRSGNARAEPSKNFHFDVTWASVTAHLSLIEAADLRFAATVERKQASRAAAAAVAVVAPIQQPRVQSEAKARWEMVVPKMDRVNRVPQALPSGADYDRPPASIPAMSALPAAPPAPFLSRALAVMGVRGRASNLQVLQLNAPSPANPPEKTANEGRELLLSKITKSLRSRAQESALL
jgi:hypothetical protein